MQRRQLYTQESSRLLGVAVRITRDKALAEDIVHDAFIKVWCGLAGAGLATTLVLATLLLTRAPIAEPSYVVVLVAPQSQAG